MRIIYLLATCFSLVACASNQPIVDMQGVNPRQYNRDLVACEAYADQVEIDRKVVVGAAAGAAVGGAVGAIVGDSDTAKRAAGVGAVGGGVRAAGQGLRERERVIRRCLAGRGYRVLN